MSKEAFNIPLEKKENYEFTISFIIEGAKNERLYHENVK